MNTEDRINAITSDSADSGYDSGGRSPAAAGAYPMNTMDRINGAWRARSLQGSQSPKSTLRGGGSGSGVAVTTPSLKDRPDAWRYRWHRNQWWYYGANNQWSYWTGDHWNAYQTASAAEHDSTGNAH